VLEYPGLQLLPGHYLITLGVFDKFQNAIIYRDRAYSFMVTGVAKEIGLARLPHRWELTDKSAPAIKQSVAYS